ncbi:hypothetical protein GCM10025762_16200 [Haloechinothrix salitolerans]|uniref:hypothetical protein n=1 Tax=Haloechinothrix salitolerans TaxID=926830 RepID=UPI0031EBAF19
MTIETGRIRGEESVRDGTGAGIDEMLTVVDHQQESRVPEVVDQPVERCGVVRSQADTLRGGQRLTPYAGPRPARPVPAR